MSTLKLSGVTSGSSIIKAPDSGSTGVTFTLPASAGTLLTTTGSGANLTGVGVAGISSSADATAITIDSSEQVGIANTSPNSYDAEAKNLVVGSGTGHQGMTIVAGTSSKSKIHFADGTGAAAYKGIIHYDHNNDTLNLGTIGNECLTIDSTGVVTKPLQPAFLAKLASNMNNIPNSTWTTIEASTEIFDQNSDYNTSTYTFTAPVTGRYQFNAMVRMENVDNNTDYQYVVFSTDNRVYYTLQSWRQTADVPQTHHQLAILADMDANDTCRVRVYIANGHAASDIADTTIWSGHLVC